MRVSGREGGGNVLRVGVPLHVSILYRKVENGSAPSRTMAKAWRDDGKRIEAVIMNSAGRQAAEEEECQRCCAGRKRREASTHRRCT